MLQCATTARNTWIQLDPQRPALLAINSKDRTSSSAELLYAAIDELLYSGLMKPAIRDNDEWKEPDIGGEPLPDEQGSSQVPRRFSAIHFQGECIREATCCTLDEAQGDEADIVFFDFVLTGNPGFITANFRVALALSRARVATALLLNRGTFSGWETKQHTQQRALQLFGVHDHHEKHGLIVRVWCCEKEPTPNPDLHCLRASCGQNGHLADNCPLQELASI
ncbi:hypothetical protein NW762_012269 [Fusarium torreyae]|uniref:Uncharacterized protein n=1 Tax=Fusarium torreyae TaxID=1237075 RepID=A0A9W8RPE9_9HYPO|nr:hypothetical protein NW762_012269 [Fusarium torreyae]